MPKFGRKRSHHVMDAWPYACDPPDLLDVFFSSIWGGGGLTEVLDLMSAVIRERAEYCFESTVSEERTHWVLRQTRWVLRETRWVRFGPQKIGWEELTELAPRNSVSPKKLTEFGVWNRTPRNRIRPVSEWCLAQNFLFGADSSFLTRGCPLILGEGGTFWPPPFAWKTLIPPENLCTPIVSLCAPCAFPTDTLTPARAHTHPICYD